MNSPQRFPPVGASGRGTPANTESSLDSLFNNAPDAVARFDRELRHVYVNAAAARANNRPVEDFYLKKMRELGHAEEISSLIEANLRNVFETGAERTFDVDFSGPWGSKYYQCRMAPENDSSGAVRYVIVFSRDLTQQKIAEQQLIEAERLAARSNLAYELAHELNNPLQALRNSIFLLQNLPSEPEAKNVIQTADRVLTRIEAEVRTILLLREQRDGKS
jgi:nitrogen-specific signal transduction histidine kinase